MPHPYHLIVEGNPALVYATRGGSPEKILPILTPFLEKFWRERETFGEYADTPECLVAQLTVRFGFETAEDDFSNIRVGVRYNPGAQYLYWIGLNKDVQVWVAEEAYRQDPELGLGGCRQWVSG
ncbi:MAG: histidine kinase [Oscillatoriales cyanobacterium C42_A2020_001]|nr:histidine kinase [Leptolyngbyaceae cyanobacterium C42_A2020_001]